MAADEENRRPEVGAAKETEAWRSTEVSAKEDVWRPEAGAVMDAEMRQPVVVSAREQMCRPVEFAVEKTWSRGWRRSPTRRGTGGRR